MCTSFHSHPKKSKWNQLSIKNIFILGTSPTTIKPDQLWMRKWGSMASFLKTLCVGALWLMAWDWWKWEIGKRKARIGCEHYIRGDWIKGWIFKGIIKEDDWERGERPGAILEGHNKIKDSDSFIFVLIVFVFLLSGKYYLSHFALFCVKNASIQFAFFPFI